MHAVRQLLRSALASVDVGPGSGVRVRVAALRELLAALPLARGPRGPDRIGRL